jgi:hypothetical protein
MTRKERLVLKYPRTQTEIKGSRPVTASFLSIFDCEISEAAPSAWRASPKNRLFGIHRLYLTVFDSLHPSHE